MVNSPLIRDPGYFLEKRSFGGVPLGSHEVCCFNALLISEKRDGGKLQSGLCEVAVATTLSTSLQSKVSGVEGGPAMG